MNEHVQSLIVQVHSVSKKLEAISTAGALHQIEKDMLLADIRALYEKVLGLQTIPSLTPPAASTAAATAPPATQAITSLHLHLKSTPDAEHTKPEHTHTKAAVVGEPATTAELLDMESETTAAPATTPVTEQQKHEIVAEKYIKKENAVHESIAPKAKDLSSVLQSRPVKDLATAIGVNERFVFARELFQGNLASYDKAISGINAAQNFNEAYNFMLHNFAWDMESATVHKLLALVRRRFISIEAL